MVVNRFGKTIELFLEDGIPEGVVVASISNWSGGVVKIPRINIKDCGIEEIKKIGVYILFCTEENGEEKVYVGEAENVQERLKQHIDQYQVGKESFYWSQAVVFTDDRLDKAEVRYIENKFAEIVTRIDSSKLLTKKTYKNTTLKRSQIAKVEEFIYNSRMVLRTLGFETLTEVQKAPENTIYFYCKGTDALAKGFLSSGGFTIEKGSKVSSKTVKSFEGTAYYKLREKLISEGVINSSFEFSKDYEFKAPSAASSVVLGSASNGKDKWKTNDGVKFSEIEV